MNQIIRGTTPTINYSFSFAASTIEKTRIYFIQGNETLLTKDEDDCTMNGNTVSVTLTEAETYLFSVKKRLETNARVMQTGGFVGATKSVFIDIDDTGGGEEILVEESTEESNG